MEFWPVDHRSSIKKGKGIERTDVEPKRNGMGDEIGTAPLGPVLSPTSGSVGGAALRFPPSGRPEWDMITKSSEL
jgi:hypothetical protein